MGQAPVSSICPTNTCHASARVCLRSSSVNTGWAPSHAVARHRRKVTNHCTRVGVGRYGPLSHPASRMPGGRTARRSSTFSAAGLDKREVSLRQVWGKSIYYGIKTGYNPAFIVDTATKERLVTEDPRSAEIIKPILRGRDIGRYRAEWAGLWLIATLPSVSIDIDAYPAVKKHLLSFGRRRLSQTGTVYADGTKSRKKTPHRWFELQDTCAYHGEFAAPKLLWIELADRGRFAFDDTGTLAEATAFMLTGEPAKYLCGILNSQLAQWFLQHCAPTSGMGALRWKKAYLLHLPIPGAALDRRQRLIRLVDRVLRAKDTDRLSDTSGIEAEIDQQVFNLYGLNARDIEAVRL